LTKLSDAATLYIRGFDWCEEVTLCVPHLEIGDVLGVFKVELSPAHADVDPVVWAVVGDVPPAYIAFEEGDSWRDSLRGYVQEMERWISAVKAGESTDELIPVNAAPTAANAALLDSRLAFIRSRLTEADSLVPRHDV
jgi:hypothetical protein